MPVRVDRSDDIQKALTNVYLKLFTEIKKNPNYPTTTVLLKNQYNRKVHDATRKAITDVFAQGHNYVGRQLKVETFQNDSDTALIKQETDKSVAMFWTRLDADARRQVEIQGAEARLILTESKDEFDTLFFLENAALITTTGALAISTLTKSQQIINDPELPTEKPRIRWVAQLDERTCKVLPNGNPGCYYLDGQTWYIAYP